MSVNACHGAVPAAHLPVAVHGCLLVGAMTSSAPILTAAMVPNGPTSGQAFVTVSGMNFGGASDMTASMRIASRSCITAAWTSVSSLFCVHGASSFDEGPCWGIGAWSWYGGHTLASTVGGVVGTALGIFSFDGECAVPCT